MMWAWNMRRRGRAGGSWVGHSIGQPLEGRQWDDLAALRFGVNHGSAACSSSRRWSPWQR